MLVIYVRREEFAAIKVGEGAFAEAFSEGRKVKVQRWKTFGFFGLQIVEDVRGILTAPSKSECQKGRILYVT